MKNKLYDSTPKNMQGIMKLLLGIYILFASLYLIWRFSTVGTWDAWYAYPLLAGEIWSICMSLIFLVTTRRFMLPKWQKPLKNTTIDIFVTTYNEPKEIIKMTLVGALEVKGARNVYLLDDGNRNNVKRLAKKLGVRYVARTNNLHAKAGNMNHGIQYSDAEYMVFLDCDHVPQPNFIDRTSGYFRDKRLAFVQTPQVFYNSESVQFRKTKSRTLWNEQSMFYECIQPAKNAFNAAFFCGSGSMLRRSAIDSVGGFATGTATEDIHTALRLHASGWRSLFIDEQLAHGIAAMDLTEYHKQRVRWGAGSLGLLFRSPDSPLWSNGLNFMQRLCYFSSTVSFLNGFIRLLYIIIPALLLLSLPFSSHSESIPVITYTVVALPFIAFSYLLTYIFSRKTFHPLYTEQFNILNIFANIMAIKGVLQVEKKFKVSIKQKLGKQESSAYKALLFLWVIAFMGLYIGLYWWFVYLEKDASSLFKTAYGAALIWNLVNLYFLSSIIWFTNFHNETISGEKTLVYPDQIEVVNAKPANLILSRMCLTSADLIASTPIKHKRLICKFTNNSSSFTVKAKVNDAVSLVTGENKLSISFYDLNMYEEKELIKYMFHGLVPQMFKTDKYLLLKRRWHNFMQRTQSRGPRFFNIPDQVLYFALKKLTTERQLNNR